MTTANPKIFRQARAPKPGMTIEPVITYEELPIMTPSARAELLTSLKRGEADRRAGRGKALSADSLKTEMRASFEKISGMKVP